MRHFVYKHLPAGGLGHRDPRRPHVAGGLGAGTWVWKLLQYSQSVGGTRSVVSHEGRTDTESREAKTDFSSRENKRVTDTIGDFS